MIKCHKATIDNHSDCKTMFCTDLSTKSANRIFEKYSTGRKSFKGMKNGIAMMNLIEEEEVKISRIICDNVSKILGVPKAKIIDCLSCTF